MFARAFKIQAYPLSSLTPRSSKIHICRWDGTSMVNSRRALRHSSAGDLRGMFLQATVPLLPIVTQASTLLQTVQHRTSFARVASTPWPSR